MCPSETDEGAPQEGLAATVTLDSPPGTLAATGALAATLDLGGQTVLRSGEVPGAREVDLPATPNRYVPGGLLGRGGMGEVRDCHDAVMGRDVAMKVMHRPEPLDPRSRARFVREARVQGLLEHPAIVPIYDLGQDEAGAPFFVMKRVHGLTLDAVLRQLAEGDPSTVAGYGRHRLLSAFCNICLAVDYAHSRGVVHRDLKPQNIMLGDFGEVHVLDWGVARLSSEVELAPVTSTHARRLTAGEAGGTPATDAQIVGTLGYIAPEHLGGESVASTAGDLFALGALLFEILTLERLVPRGTAEEMMRATLRGVEADPARRAAERAVPPELRVLCVQATALDPAERPPSARALCDAVQRYLEGDRDLERRRGASREHAERAEEALDQALLGEVEEAVSRSRAMSELNRALALDPDNREALRTMMRLLTEPPREIPEEVHAQAAANDRAVLRQGARVGSITPFVYLLMVPLVMWLGVRSWWQVGAVLVLMGGAAFCSHRLARHALIDGGRLAWVALQLLRALALVMLTRMFGPLVLVPTLATAFAVIMQVHSIRAMRHLGGWLGCAVVAVPTLLEAGGWLPRSYAFSDGRMSIVPQMHGLTAVPSTVLLLVSSVLVTAMASIFVGRIRAALSTATLRLQLNAWHLERLIPDEQRPEG